MIDFILILINLQSLILFNSFYNGLSTITQARPLDDYHLPSVNYIVSCVSLHKHFYTVNVFLT